MRKYNNYGRTLSATMRALDKELQKPPKETPDERRLRRNLYQRIYYFRKMEIKLRGERRFLISHYRRNPAIVKLLDQTFNEQIEQVKAKISVLELEYYAL